MSLLRCISKDDWSFQHPTPHRYHSGYRMRDGLPGGLLTQFLQRHLGTYVECSCLALNVGIIQGFSGRLQ